MRATRATVRNSGIVPFEKKSYVATALSQGLFAAGVVFRMQPHLASDQEPPFFMAINAGREKAFSPEELERVRRLTAQ